MWWTWISIASPSSITAEQDAQRDLGALRGPHAGLANAGTPLAIASTPVTAEQPDANAFSNSTIPSASVALIGPRLVPIIALAGA